MGRVECGFLEEIELGDFDDRVALLEVVVAAHGRDPRRVGLFERLAFEDARAQFEAVDVDRLAVRQRRVERARVAHIRQSAACERTRPLSLSLPLSRARAFSPKRTRPRARALQEAVRQILNHELWPEGGITSRGRFARVVARASLAKGTPRVLAGRAHGSRRCGA